MKDLIYFPKTGYKSTGENGLAVFFILPVKHNRTRRQKCITGGIVFYQDIVISPTGEEKAEKEVDLAILAGSTKNALWNEEKDSYFQASKKNLTEEGAKLFLLLTEIYGEEPTIVTLLDT